MFTLYQLNEYIRRVIALNFDIPVWVTAEISQVKESRGNLYIELLQHDESSGQVIAQSSAAIWFKTHLFLKNKLKLLLPSLLSEGAQILIKVKVDYNERYGLKLLIEDIDPAYTIGQMEIARRNILERLQKERLLDRNKSIPMPAIIQKLAIISSSRAAGYIDFVKQLSANSYGFQFQFQLFEAAMQGVNVEKEVVQQLQKIQELGGFDAIAIIRGGGSRLDLSFFDNYNVAFHIAHSKVPVITGIGHDIDESVADIVACLALKTPTAVADFLLEKMIIFESNLSQWSQWMRNLATQKIHQQKLVLEGFSHFIKVKPKTLTEKHNEKVNSLSDQIQRVLHFFIQNQYRQLQHFERIIVMADPVTTLKRGYTLIRLNGTVITSNKMIHKGDDIQIDFHDGTKKATII
ncbi:MAG TPA: exodeoxyribonuclease VII large subunit [Saprospiraceae bacterium]|nr:exodeoxyribonuclease VII large subunit [Saprospiraceae bacterium]